MTVAALNSETPERPAGTRAGPDFFCVGLMKGGTQWLYDQLQHHPDFWMPPYKELHFFDRRFPDAKIGPAARSFLSKPQNVAAKRERRGDRSIDDRDHEFYQKIVAYRRRGRKDFELYANLFDAKGDLISGDITPGYSILGNILVRRISKQFPEAKVVMMLREPASRLWSQWRMQAERKELSVERELNLGAFKAFANRKQVQLRSYPSKIASRWSSHFGDRFRYFFLDDVIAKPDETRAAILSFLGGDPDAAQVVAPDFNRKAKPPAPQRTPEIQAFLKKTFADERKACAKMFGGAALKWPDAPY